MTLFYRYTLEYSNNEQETHITLASYPIVKETPKGYWIGYEGHQWKKWVPKKTLLSRENQYAWDNKESAMKHFLRRTRKRLHWYIYWTEQCERGIALGKKSMERGRLPDHHKIEESDFE